MGKVLKTDYGTVRVLSEEEIFEVTVERMEAAVRTGLSKTIALTGGSTPKRFYQWAAARRPFSQAVIEQAVWTTSDERMVPLESEDSNFGVADRCMLQPLEIDEVQKFSWATHLDPHAAAAAYEMHWIEKFGADKAYDLCLLGMGDDGHTASIFPGSPLLGVDLPELFTCVDVPGKGWRLSITRNGLSCCREIIITVTGANKANILSEVLRGKDGRYPVQSLKACASITTWLVDEAAASAL